VYSAIRDINKVVASPPYVLPLPAALHGMQAQKFVGIGSILQRWKWGHKTVMVLKFWEVFVLLLGSW
jgi:hypothetical protein